jgi:hypothetical protein
LFRPHESLVELNLALILFLPWFTILAVLFWKFPRAAVDTLLFDSASLLLAVAAAAAGMYWSMASADRPSATCGGRCWRRRCRTGCSAGGHGGAGAALALAARPRLPSPASTRPLLRHGIAAMKTLVIVLPRG